MSEQKHTPEPWLQLPGGRHDPEVIITTQHRLDQSKGEICGMDVEFTGHHGEEQKANARRIVACINACAGYTTEELEQAMLDKRHRHEIIADLVKSNKQRDELLAALEHILAGSLSLPRFAEAEAISVIASVKDNTK